MDDLTLVTGSRTIHNYTRVEQTIDSAPFHISRFMHGGADGVDILCDEYVRKHHHKPAIVVRPDYKRFAPKIAPTYRNWQMGFKAKNVVGIWDGFSPGTARQIAIGAVLQLPLYVEIADPNLLAQLRAELEDEF